MEGCAQCRTLGHTKLKAHLATGGVVLATGIIDALLGDDAEADCDTGATVATTGAGASMA